MSGLLHAVHMRRVPFFVATFSLSYYAARSVLDVGRRKSAQKRTEVTLTTPARERTADWRATGYTESAEETDFWASPGRGDQIKRPWRFLGRQIRRQWT